MWAVAEDWTAGSQEIEPSWRFQLSVGADGDLLEAVEVHWVGDTRTGERREE